MRRHRPKHPRVRVLVFILGRRHVDHVGRGIALVLYEDVRQLYVLYRITRNAAENRGQPGCGVVADQVVNEYPPHRAHLGARFGTTQAGTEPNENGAAGKVAHGYVGNDDVFERSAVYALQCKPSQPSNTQFEIVMFLNPPLDSVPHLMRPVWGARELAGSFLKVPPSTAPTS